MSEPTTKDCSCTSCVSACHYKPGWFGSIKEVRSAAKLKGLSVREFFRQYLALDFWVHDDGPTFIVAPSVKSMPAGSVYDFNAGGACVFLTEDGRCDIHTAKPRECRHYRHDVPESLSRAEHEAIANIWRNPKARVAAEALLGRPPQAPVPTLFDMLDLIFGK